MSLSLIPKTMRTREMMSNDGLPGSVSLIAGASTGLLESAEPLAEVARAKPAVNPSDPSSIAGWGDDVQAGLASFNDAVVATATASNMGESGALIADVMAKVKGIDASKLRGSAVGRLLDTKLKAGFLSRLVDNTEVELTKFVGQFHTVGQQVNGIAKELP